MTAKGFTHVVPEGRILWTSTSENRSEFAAALANTAMRAPKERGQCPGRDARRCAEAHAGPSLRSTRCEHARRHSLPFSIYSTMAGNATALRAVIRKMD